MVVRTVQVLGQWVYPLWVLGQGLCLAKALVQRRRIGWEKTFNV